MKFGKLTASWLLFQTHHGVLSQISQCFNYYYYFFYYQVGLHNRTFSAMNLAALLGKLSTGLKKVGTVESVFLGERENIMRVFGMKHRPAVFCLRENRNILNVIL